VTKRVARAARGVVPVLRRIVSEDRWKGLVAKGRAILKGRHAQKVYYSAFSSDGKRIATRGERVVQLWDAETGALQSTLEEENDRNAILGCAFSPDSTRIVTSS